MQRFSSRQPVAFAVLVTVVFTLGLLVWALTISHSVTTLEITRWKLFGLDATRILIPVVFLTALGWWRMSGFAQRPTWSTILPFLPLLLIPLMPLLFGSGFKVTDPWDIAVLVVTYLALGFGEEAIFRGVVLRALAPRGWMHAAVLSAILFGSMHLVNLAIGNNPGNVGFQVVYTALIGFAYAAAALVTGAIWPLILIHFAQDFINAMQQAPYTTTSSSTTGIDVASGLINVAILMIFAAYGYWLLRHHLNQASTEPTRVRESRSRDLAGAK